MYFIVLIVLQQFVVSCSLWRINVCCFCVPCMRCACGCQHQQGDETDHRVWLLPCGPALTVLPDMCAFKVCRNTVQFSVVNSNVVMTVAACVLIVHFSSLAVE
jgi:hypothetical protein